MAENRAHDEIAQAVQRTLRTEARRNELLLAYGRVVATAFMASMDTLSYLFPRFAMDREAIPLWMPLAAWNGVLVSIVWLLVLRRGVYREGFRYAVPVADAVMLSVGFLGTRSGLGDAFFLRIGGPWTVAIACTFLVISGSLRLTRKAAILTTFLGILVFLVTTRGLQPLTPNIGIQVGLMLAAGLVSIWITGIVRRAVESEIGRAVLSRFLPRRVIEDAHQDPAALIGEPRSVDATVLVTDLRGFTAWSEPLSPPEVLSFLNEVQGALAEVVRDHGGTVDKFMGDGMLAVFGVPEPIPHDARQAIRAAHAILGRMDELNRSRADHGDAPLKMGIGIHSGQLIAGCLGSGLRLEFTVIGDTVNTASRLESLTKEMDLSVLMSEAVVELAEGADGSPLPALEPVGEVRLRGREAAIKAWTFAATP